MDAIQSVKIAELMEKDKLQKVKFERNKCFCPRCKGFLVVPAEAIAFYSIFYCWSCGQKLFIAEHDM